MKWVSRSLVYIIFLDSGLYLVAMLLLPMSNSLKTASSSSRCKCVHQISHQPSTQRLYSHLSAGFSGRMQSVRSSACHAYGPKVASLETQEKMVSVLTLASYSARRL